MSVSGIIISVSAICNFISDAYQGERCSPHVVTKNQIQTTAPTLKYKLALKIESGKSSKLRASIANAIFIGLHALRESDNAQPIAIRTHARTTGKALPLNSA